MSNFTFLKNEWPDLYTSAAQAEAFVVADPRSACFYARRTLELAVQWLYTHDASFKLPYQDHLSALIHEPSFRANVGEMIFAKARLVKELGNLAVHSGKPVRSEEALAATKEPSTSSSGWRAAMRARNDLPTGWRTTRRACRARCSPPGGRWRR